MLSRIRLCLGKIASTWQASTSTEPRGVVRHRQSTVGSTAELSWKPKILKPTPIGHFAEFSLRAHKLPPAFTQTGESRRQFMGSEREFGEMANWRGFEDFGFPTQFGGAADCGLSVANHPARFCRSRRLPG